MQPGTAALGLADDEILGILSRADDEELGELVALAAEICGTRAAGLTLLRGDECQVPLTHGIDPFVCPTDESFCQHTIGTEGVYLIEDASTDPRFVDAGWVGGDVGRARFYGSAPIHSPDGRMVGRLFVIDGEPRHLSGLQQRSLQGLALSMTALIEVRLLRAPRSVITTAESEQTAATVVSQLAAELSHDMKVPLTSIVASMEMLHEELGDHPDRTVGALLGQATRAADRLVRMLDQNMDFGTAVEAPVVEAVDLGLLVDQLLIDFAPVLHPSGAVVEARQLPVVHADPDGLYSVLQNLISNSVKFRRPDAPPWIRVSARRRGRSWRVSVRDNGVGIPEERRIDVFSLFSRVDGDVEGHGIGLATVARIVKAHGGRAGAKEADDGGTEIWFELPDQPADVRLATGFEAPTATAPRVVAGMRQ